MDARGRNVTRIEIQDYIPRFLRPSLHTLKVHRKFAETEFLAYAELVEGVQVDVKYNDKSDSFISIVVDFDVIDTVSGDPTVLLEPNESLMISFTVRKQLSNFEEYPNDIARGFNIAHMPVFCKWRANLAPAGTSMVYSSALLVSTPEPDFSMPFNVNAVTHMLFGILFVNTVFILFTDPEDAKVAQESLL